MKQFVYITLLLLCGFLNSHAQEVSPWEEAYNNLPQKHRDEFYEYARDFLENTYYTQISLAIDEDQAFRKKFIKDIFGDEDNINAARFQPEFLLKGGKQRFLSPSQYIEELRSVFRGKSDHLEFVVSNITEDEKVHGYTSPRNCFTQLDYDLMIKLQGQTLLKRRCRMYCLFPDTDYIIKVRLMQIEPLEDIYIASKISIIAGETRYQESDKALLQEAVKWYNQGLTEKCLPMFQELAEKGNVMAQFYLGLSYDKGKGVLKNERKAMEWYTKAAEQGHIIAQYNLALCYRYDYKDAKTAVEWYTKAAEQGYALAQNSLGYCCETGIGVPIDERKAIEWYTKAAEQGINEAKEALNRLSQRTLSSTTVIDRMWLRAKTDVAEQGDVNAQYELGLGYDKGKRVPKDVRKAIEWYTKAAEQGHIIAQYNLALCYRYDYKDARTAVEWYTKAAKQGYALAQNSLGYCYETGIGVPIDERKAIGWYTKAAEQGMNEAKDALKRLNID